MTVAAWVLGLAWGAIAAAPFVTVARRDSAARRGVALRVSTAPSTATARPTRVHLGVVGRVWRGLRTRRATALERAALVAEIPIVVDLLAVAVGAGSVPFSAVGVAARWSSPRTARHMGEVVRRCELGSSFEAALEEMARSAPPLASVVEALLVTDRTGAPVGPALARLAADARADARRRAEAHARAVPVRLLFPLVFLVLPAFGLLTVVPTLLAGFTPA